jgi:prepilin peptidase CpaA
MNLINEENFISLCFAGFALAFSLGAAYFDLKTRKIPNKYNLAAFVFVLLCKVLLLKISFAYLVNGVLGGLLGFVILLPFFIFRFVGGGDIKLLTVLGLVVGWKPFLAIFVLTFLCDGLIVMPLNTIRTLYLFFNLPVSLEEKIKNIFAYLKDIKRKIPFALPVFLGCLSWLLILIFKPSWFSWYEDLIKIKFLTV